MRQHEYIDNKAKLFGSEVAIYHAAREWTYTQIVSQSKKLGGAISKYGEGRGQLRIAVYSPNCALVPMVLIAISRTNALVISVHAADSVDANKALLDYADCNFMFYHPRYASEVTRFKEALPKIEMFVALEGVDASDPDIEGFISRYEGACPDLWSGDGVECRLSPTGGTTGPSKGVIHTHRSREMMYIMSCEQNAPDRDTRQLVIAPMTHAAGVLALNTLCGGGALVIGESTVPGDILDLIEEKKVTELFVPPTLLYGLLDEQEKNPRDVGSMTHLMTGAAPVAADKARRAIKLFGPVLYEGYGQSESGLPLLWKGPMDYMQGGSGQIDMARLRTTGRPNRFCSIEIMREDGSFANIGEEGEIVVRSDSLMKEYYKMPDETAEFFRFGWAHTGDVGVKDVDGYITIVDRIKDMIVSGGFNMFPGAIEAAILKDENIVDCVVVGVPDQKWGEAVTAVVQVREGGSLDEEYLRELVEKELGRIFVPKRIVVKGTLPRSPVGKVLRRVVRDEFWKGQWRKVGG